MDDSSKETLLERFRAYLDGLEGGDAEAAPDEASETADLYSIFVELAGLRSEVRAEARLLKDALDQFRSVFDSLQASHAEMEAELKRTRGETREQGRALVRPLLLDIIDVRDRLAAALKSGAAATDRPWYRRFGPKREIRPEPWQEGVSMTLRRLDRLLADRRIMAIETIGRPFDPRVARAVGVVRQSAAPEGTVVEELRPGFLWEDEVLRTAEVAVAKGSAGKGDLT